MISNLFKSRMKALVRQPWPRETLHSFNWNLTKLKSKILIHIIPIMIVDETRVLVLIIPFRKWSLHFETPRILTILSYLTHSERTYMLTINRQERKHRCPLTVRPHAKQMPKSMLEKLHLWHQSPVKISLSTSFSNFLWSHIRFSIPNWKMKKPLMRLSCLLSIFWMMIKKTIPSNSIIKPNKRKAFSSLSSCISLSVRSNARYKSTLSQKRNLAMSLVVLITLLNWDILLTPITWEVYLW